MGMVFDVAPVAMRPAMQAALEQAWAELGAPGDWLDGATRLAVAAEARRAWDCELCARRKAALTPYAVDGEHDYTGALPAAWVDVVHRLTRDSGRLTAAWFGRALAGGMAEDEFIEIVSVTVLAITIDAYLLGIGMAPPALPDPVAGEPPRQRVAAAKPGPGWVATIAPEDVEPDFADFYANGSHFYIRRALTLLPAETRRMWALLNTLYLEDPRVHELDGLDRAISRAQMEFLAARASALLGCYY
jgi:hypothetical protein